MLTNIQSLFADILQTPQQRAMQLRNEGLTRAELATRGLSGGGQLLAPLISAQAQNAPMIEDMIRRGVGGLFGQDTRTESESIQNILSQADTATPEGQQALIAALRNQGYGVQAAQLQQQMLAQQEQQAETALNNVMRLEQIRAASSENAAAEAAPRLLAERRTALQNLLAESSIDDRKKTAVGIALGAGAYDASPKDLIEILFPEADEEENPYSVVGNNIFNKKTGTWVTPPAVEGETGLDISATDPDQYDPESFSKFVTASQQARTPEAREAARSLLLPKAPAGYSWDQGFDENNNPIAVQRPVRGSEKYTEVLALVNAANNTAGRVINSSENTVAVADKILDALVSGKAETGIPGIVLSLIPETDEANIASSLDTLLSNLGIGELEAMRAASANGASGFGQLTERELQRLEARIRSLSQRQSRAQQIENISFIRNAFADMANKAKTDWTVDEWIGIAPRPATPAAPATPTGASVTTPSGTYTVRPANAQ
jgi:hypothetical protein